MDMLHYLTDFYGSDWAAMVLTFLSIYYLGNSKRIGFIFGIGAGISWTVFGVLVGSIASPIANAIFIYLNLRGYLKWKKEGA